MVPQHKDVIPREYRDGASRPGRNSTKATWWCLLKGIIPRRPRGDASLLGHNSTAAWWCLIMGIRIVKSWGS